MTASRSLLLNAGLVLASLLLSFGLAEAGARLFLLGSPIHPLGDAVFVEPDPELGWRLIPGRSGLARGPGYVVPLRINSRGLRDIERGYDKKPGTFRIVVLGDSVMEAYQVLLQDSFCRRLEAELNSASPSGPRFEVVNLGVRGYGAGQEYLYLLREGFKYRPDQVLLAFFPANDLADDSPALDRELYGPEHFKSAARPFFRLSPAGRLERAAFDSARARRVVGRQHELKAALQASPRPFWKRSLVLSLLAAKLRHAPPFRSGPQPVHALYGLYARRDTPAWSQAWALSKRLILEIRDASRAAGARFTLIGVPADVETDGRLREELPRAHPELAEAGLDAEKPHRILEDFARRSRIDYIPLLPAFRRHIETTGERLHHAGDIHWNRGGHRLAARAAAAALRESAARP
jgi:hypothetical protein